VTASVEHGQARQLIGPDGIPLVTAHGTATTDADRRVAAGEVGVVDPPQLQVSSELLRTRVVRSWTGLEGVEKPEDRHRRRAEWAAGAGVPATSADRPWNQIPGPQQSQLIASWLDGHQAQRRKLAAGRPPPDPPFIHAQRLLTGFPEAAAAAMFNHTPCNQPPQQPAAAAHEVARALFPTAASRAGGQGPAPSTTVARPPQVQKPDPGLQR
jgi:hypothetical protein